MSISVLNGKSCFWSYLFFYQADWVEILHRWNILYFCDAWKISVHSAQQKRSYDQKVIFGIRTLMRLDLDYCSFLVYWKAHNFFSTERNGLKFCMHDRNMLWKAHDFLAYARQPRTAQTSIHHPDAGTGPGPLAYIDNWGY